MDINKSYHLPLYAPKMESNEGLPLDLCTKNKYSSFTSNKGDIYTTEYTRPNSVNSSNASNNGSDTSEVSTETYTLPYFPQSTNVCSRKPTRPFKAFPKNPATSLPIAGMDIVSHDTSEAYLEFRAKMLAQVQATHSSTNKNMRRNSQCQQSMDPEYYEKRKKNNEAAKRSRDARRAKEDEIAIRCAFLEQENMQLKFRIAGLEAERQRLQSIMYR